MKCSRIPFGPVLFVFEKKNVHYITGYRTFYKNHFSIHPGKGTTLCGIVIHSYPFQHPYFVPFSSHPAKITPYKSEINNEK
jgi:hypothetical protein